MKITKETTKKIVLKDKERSKKMKKLYRIKFDTKKGGFKSWAIDVEANNRKEAQQIAEDRWYEGKYDIKPHMFHIETRVLKETEEFLYHHFVRVEKEGGTI